MAEPRRRSKRLKTEDCVDVSDAPESLTRSEFWMEYGDIMLVAESTLFCVNRDIIANKSDEFKVMVADSDIEKGERIEGRPVLRLSDSAKDVELLLKAFYDSFYGEKKLPFDVLSCSLRLGRKYGAHAFKDDALNRLHREFPAKLNAWDARMKGGLNWIVSAPGIYIDLLNLAYETGIHTIIPALAFRCLRLYRLSQLFDGFERTDGSHATLTDEMKLMLARALEEIQIMQHANLQNWLGDNVRILASEDCSSCRRCEEEKKHMRIISCGPSKVDISFLLDSWEKVTAGSWAKGLCNRCRKVAREAYNEEREEAWKALPAIFGLPDWNDLRDTGL